MSHHTHSASGPFVWGVGVRLAVAAALGAGLWLAVAWALEWI
ncbi:MAG TPA: hypothetical protein VM661_07880 [Candidatus Sulfotelmatobacter sp.]|nr:hypothetical protein [Candidatus Sulfotelmatobacter sp.]